MIRFMRIVMREALASAMSQPVVSVLAAAMVASMCSALTLTAGRAAGAEREVLGAVDAVGTRTIVVRAEIGADLSPQVVLRLESLDRVEQVLAFGPSQDVFQPSGVGGRVSLRSVWGLGEVQPPVQESTVLLSDRAANSVGLPDGVGSLVTLDRLPYSAAGFYRPMRTIEFLQPLALAPRRLSEEGEVAIVVVLARKPRDVAVLAEVIRPLLDPVDPLKVSFETSGRLAALRATIERQLSGFGRASVVVIVVLNGTLVATLLYGMVLLRRKDFGRRRALGASRSFIVALVAGQAVLVSSLGATLGLALGHTALVLSDQPLPTVRFTGAVFVLALTTSIVAAFAPAWAASRRDPVLELRVP